jgi:diacylglycerol kinase
MVWVAEIFNTAIEKTMDFISRERHPQIKLIKDLAAAAVLVTAFSALITGAIIFIPKLLK